MKYTPAELRLIKRFEKKFRPKMTLMFSELNKKGMEDKITIRKDRSVKDVEDFLIKEVRRARRAGFKEGDKWIQSREYKSLAEIMKPPMKNGVINGECPKCGGTSDGQIYMSNPPQKKCSICGTYWFYTVQTKDRSY